jgi:hypothetical protein
MLQEHTPRQHLDAVGQSSRLWLETRDDAAADARLLSQRAQPPEIAVVHPRGALDLDGQIEVPRDDVDFVTRCRAPEPPTSNRKNFSVSISRRRRALRQGGRRKPR